MKPPRIIPLLVCLISFVCVSHAYAIGPLNVTSDQTLTAGYHEYTNLTISNNATLYVDGTAQIDADNIMINAGSSIDARGVGFGPNQGPGAGSSSVTGGTGGAYGGNGGENNIVTGGGHYYGSATEPFERGSGGGNDPNITDSAGSGGGAIWLNVANTLTINGTLTANGTDAASGSTNRAGGGSGGAILIDTATLAGSGVIESNGGAGGESRGGGGSGGRIAVYYNTSTFSGTVAATGGASVEDLYASESDGEDGTIGFFDVDDNKFFTGSTWRFQVDDGPFDFDTITLDNGSVVTSEGTLSITGTNLLVDGGATLYLGGAETLVFGDVDIEGNSEIIGNMMLRAANVTIESGSEISANGKGFSGDRGVGAGLENGFGTGGSGGGYGGEGGDSSSPGGIAYGSATAPVDLGSGGSGPGYTILGQYFPSSGGAGGGRIQLNIADTLTVNGTLSADGYKAGSEGPQAGGGSGGSIYVIAERFTGSGAITANGGDSSLTLGSAAGGGGGGGRIAVFHRQAETYTGAMTATGGDGKGEDGVDGTVVQSQSVLAISPTRGGDTGRVSTFISGSIFEKGSEVKLTKSGYSDIMADFVSVERKGVLLRAVFEFDGATQGAWNVVVSQPNGTLTLTNGFTIEDMRPNGFWMDILGRGSIRPDRQQTFHMVYGNTGNTDVYSADMFLEIPDNVDYQFLDFQDSFINPSADTTAQVLPLGIPPLFSNTLQFYVKTSSLSGILEFCFAQANAEDGDLGFTELVDNYDILFETEPPVVDAPEVSEDELFLQKYQRGSYGRKVETPNYYVHAFVLKMPGGGTENSVGYYEDGGVWVNVRDSNVVKIDWDDFLDGEAVVPLSTSGNQTIGIDHQGSYRPDDPEKMKDLADRISLNISRLKNSLVYCNPTNYGAIDSCIHPDNNRASCTGFVSLSTYSVETGGGLLKIQERPYPCKRTAEVNGQVIEVCQQSDIIAYLANETYLTDVILNAQLVASEIGQEFKDWWDSLISVFDCITVSVVISLDPNEIVGPNGVGVDKYISADRPLRYVIYFENIETATGAAQEVVVTDQLDSTKMDLDTFSLGAMGFGDIVVTPPVGLKEYITEVDLRPDTNLLVRIEAGLDSSSGVVTWRFTSLDPDTHRFTDDPNLGFLPPNSTPPEGDGFVHFTVNSKSSIATNDVIENNADIVFDTNSAITTNTWSNKIDDTPPQSSVNSMASTQTSVAFDISWTGSDAHAGVRDYRLYVSENSGPFVEELVTTGTMTTFVGVNGNTYSFYTIARDRVGNYEDAPTSPDVTLTISDPMQEPCTVYDDYLVGVSCFSSETVTNDSELDDYLFDFGYNGSKYKDLIIDYDVDRDDMDIHSPCEIKIKTTHSLTGQRICIDGREGVSSETYLTVNGTFVTLISELGDVDIGHNSHITAKELTLQAYETAEISVTGSVTVADDLIIKSTGNTISSKAKMGQDSIISAGSVRLESSREVSTGPDMTLDVDGALEMISTGTESTSKAIIGISSDITAASLEMSADKSVDIGADTNVTISGSAIMISTGSSLTSDVELGNDASITADSLDMTGGDDASLQPYAEVTTTNNFNMEADTPGDCTIAGTAIITAGSESGNCL